MHVIRQQAGKRGGEESATTYYYVGTPYGDTTNLKAPERDLPKRANELNRICQIYDRKKKKEKKERIKAHTTRTPSPGLTPPFITSPCIILFVAPDYSPTPLHITQTFVCSSPSYLFHPSSGRILSGTNFTTLSVSTLVSITPHLPISTFPPPAITTTLVQSYHHHHHYHHHHPRTHAVS